MPRRQTPRFFYNQQKQNAKKRGVPWEFTFETWWKVWEESGLWEKRGRHIGEYVMARDEDRGTYRPDNVSIVPVSENNSNGLKGWAEKKRARQQIENVGVVEVAKALTNSTLSYKIPATEIPIEKFIEKKEQFKKLVLSKEQDAWSWRKIIKQAFPVLSRFIHG